MTNTTSFQWRHVNQWGPSAILSALFLTLVEMWSSGNCPPSHLLEVWSEIGKD